MLGRIVEVADNHRHLSLYRGFLVVQATSSGWPELGRVPPDDINYGYTVYRSATARAVVAAGLHPAIGLHHSNDGNLYW